MLNKGQKEAVESTHDKILCLAGAGTGKTYTMIARISKLVSEGVDPASILVLTFTNAAALEMGERYRKSHTEKVQPKFCTFHGFCYQLIAHDVTIRTSLGYNVIPNIPDNSLLKRFEVSTKQICGTKLSGDKLAGKVPLSPKEQWEFDLYHKKFNKTLKQNGYITFDMMCYEICKLFNEDAFIIQKYKQKYNYIFVDEFQDTDPRQWEFVSSFTDSKLFVVGDIFQAIYAFRGADSSIIKSLAENDDWQTIRLVENYRSTQQICEYANTINNDADPIYRIELKGMIEGKPVRHKAYVDNKYDYEGLEAIIQSITKTVTLNQSVAILCRSNAEVDTVKGILTSINYPFMSNSHNQENTANILKSAVDDEYAVNWLSSLLDSSKYSEYIKLCATNTTYTRFDMFKDLYKDHRLISSLIYQIEDISVVLNDNTNVPFRRCEIIAEKLDIPNRNFMSTSTKPADIAEYLINVINDTAGSQLYVGTIHSVKGLEYDVVHVLGVGSSSFRINSEEMKNLYYVACTRAKSLLYVYGN